MNTGFDKGALPRVSIVTPTFNLIKNGRRESFMQMVQSVHGLWYSNIEHLIVDGGSSDGTVGLLEDYAKKGWLKYWSAPDGGIYDAMNKGIDKSSGKYVIFMNSDDYFISCTAVRDEVKLAEEKKSDYVFANCLMLDNELEWVFGNNMSLFWNRMPFNHQTMLCKRSVLAKFGGFDLKYRYAADYDLILKCIFNDLPYAHMNRSVAAFRMTGATVMNKPESLKEQCDILIKHCSPFYAFDSLDVVVSLVRTGRPPRDFLPAMRAYMVSKKFRNLDDIRIRNSHSERKIRLLGILPFLKVVDEIV